MKRLERVPLLHDGHSHTGLYAAMASCPDLSALDGRRARELLASLPRDRLTVVRGWRTNVLPLERAELASLPPALIVNVSLHGYAASDAALGFLADRAPELAERRGDASWAESHVPALFEAYCDLAGLDEGKLAAHFRLLEEAGTGSAEDLAVPSLTAFRAMRASSYAGRLAYWAAPGLYRRMGEEERGACSGIKLFLDGSIGARTAAVREPWIGGGASTLAYADTDLDDELGLVMDWKAGLAVHAIGELAIDQALGALERARSSGAFFPVLRLEHVQFISRAQARRARDLGAVLSMQPNFSRDSRDYADRLGKAYLEANNPFRMLIDELGFRPGIDLVFGSDGMPHGIAYAAEASLYPECPGQRLSLDELVAGYGLARGASGWQELELDDERLSVRRIPRR